MIGDGQGETEIHRTVMGLVIRRDWCFGKTEGAKGRTRVHLVFDL